MAREAARVTRTVDSEADRGRMRGGAGPQWTRQGDQARGSRIRAGRPGHPWRADRWIGGWRFRTARTTKAGDHPRRGERGRGQDRIIAGRYRQSRPRSSATATARRRSWSIAGRTEPAGPRGALSGGSGPGTRSTTQARGGAQPPRERCRRDERGRRRCWPGSTAV